MILFVGDNNSGKSYLMSLLWGILTIGKEIFPFKESSVESYQKCDKWLTEHYGKDIEIDDVVETFFVNWFNELLDREKKDIAKKIFNYPVEIGKVKIEDFERTPKLKIKWEETAQKFSIAKHIIKFP